MNAFGLNLQDALQKAANSAPQLLEIKSQIETQRAQSGAIQGAYDITLYGKANYAVDKTEQTSSFSGEERKKTNINFGAKKLFSTGTAIDIQAGHNISELIFGSNTGAFNPSTTIDPNPANQSMISISIKQSLLKNFMAREVELQNALAIANISTAEWQLKLVKQMVQAETESLFFLGATLEKQIAILRQLVSKTNRYAKLMEKRVGLGRADQVDLANARIQAVKSEGNLLGLEIQRDNIVRKLQSNIHSNQPLNLKDINLKTSVLNSIESPTKALETATNNRIDIKTIEAKLNPIRIQEQISKEKSKPSLDIVARGAYYGLDKDASSAWSENLGLDQPQFFIGVEFSWKPWSKEYKANQKGSIAQKSNLESQKSSLLHNLKRDIEIAFMQKDSAQKKLKQANRQIYSLGKRLREERKKFTQARGEQIVSLLYEIESLNAKIEQINAYKDARMAEASIRLHTHTYPY